MLYHDEDDENMYFDVFLSKSVIDIEENMLDRRSLDKDYEEQWWTASIAWGRDNNRISLFLSHKLRMKI